MEFPSDPACGLALLGVEGERDLFGLECLDLGCFPASCPGFFWTRCSACRCGKANSGRGQLNLAFPKNLQKHDSWAWSKTQVQCGEPGWNFMEFPSDPACGLALLGVQGERDLFGLECLDLGCFPASCPGFFWTRCCACRCGKANSGRGQLNLASPKNLQKHDSWAWNKTKVQCGEPGWNFMEFPSDPACGLALLGVQGERDLFGLECLDLGCFPASCPGFFWTRCSACRCGKANSGRGQLN